ncbi:class I SAM-dependent methyltransferase [Paractinoplanes toevensis]|uniref:Methyltransferase n=1 Tax=Paractinoplanes toevensis TaxID=571911 RepID=A0A920BQ34_9ACTN|nr:class I SAM-dependent methyltransferase [Actinoplanes toevensis]GIM96316.1 methyltransferase [Actinoplanes toevensis]
MTILKGNPVRGRLNAVVLRGLDNYGGRLLGPRKRELFADLPPTVVEIGPGTGANLRFYKPGTRLVAIEPNPYMHGPLMAEARRRDIDVELRAEGAERMDFPDGSVDAVVSTLVLCSVPDPVAAIREIGRILRPGGRLVFVEHVRAGDHAGYAAVQRLVARPWRWLFEGCDVGRDTETMLRACGFELEVERYRMSSVLLPINPQIAGVARR